MRLKPIRDTLIALAALGLALAAAFWLDGFAGWLRLRASQTFDYAPALWLPPLLQLADGAGLVALVWWLATRADSARAIDALYALAGLAAALSLPLVVATHLSGFGWLVFNAGGRMLCWTMTGDVLALAGLLHLFRRRPVAQVP